MVKGTVRARRVQWTAVAGHKSEVELTAVISVVRGICLQELLSETVVDDFRHFALSAVEGLVGSLFLLLVVTYSTHHMPTLQRVRLPRLPVRI